MRRIVDADAQLKSWNERRLRDEALLRCLRRGLPRPVAERVHVADSRTEVLELATSAGAIAAIVRQHGPTLVRELRREGWHFTRLSVRVQPATTPMPTEKGNSHQWDNRNRPALEALCARLSPGPLKKALMRFLRSR